MRVSDIKTAIENVRAVLASGGATAAEKDLALLADTLSSGGDRDLDAYLSDVEAKLSPTCATAASVKDVGAYVRRLKEAGFDEVAFKSVLFDIDKDVTLGKPEVTQIAREHGVIRIEGRSKKALSKTPNYS